MRTVLQYITRETGSKSIGYALENGNKAAAQFFFKQSDIAVKAESETKDNKNLF